MASRMQAIAAEGGVGSSTTDATDRPAAPLYHRAVELVGKRWTGAILFVLMDGPLRFSEIKQLVPDLSDRLLSERLKELEAEGIVERRVIDGAPCASSTRSPPKGGRSSRPSARSRSGRAPGL